MKINKAKLLVGTLAIAAVAATAGSISGTIAWYQYSTRVTAAYQGAAAHCSENLEIRIRSENTTAYEWKHDLTTDQIASYLSAAAGSTTFGGGRTVAANTLRPVTAGEMTATEVKSTFYKNPIYQYADMSTWGTATATEDYIVLPLEVRVKDVNGAAEASASYLAKNIYVTDLKIEARADHTGYTASEHLDLSSAIRVGISAGQTGEAKTAYATFSTDGAAVVVAGALDLNGDGTDDQTQGYDFDTGRTTIKYGYTSGEAADHKALSTSAVKLTDTATSTTVGVAYDANPLEIKGKPIGATAANKNLEIDVLIYLEGWKTLGSPAKAIWDATKAIGAEFNLGIQFSADAHTFAD